MMPPAAETACSAKDAAAPPRALEYLFGGSSQCATSLEEERREVLDSVLQAMRVPIPDAGRMAACAYLLRHLARTEHCVRRPANLGPAAAGSVRQ